MAYYDKSKLLKMIEQRRQALVALRDLSDRRREAKDDEGRLRATIESATDHRARRDGVIDRLLNLSFKAASLLGTAEIQEYDAGDGVVRSTGINAGTYRRYISARECSQRLGCEYEKASGDFHARFGVVPRLVQAVKDWGFADPELGVL